VLPVCPCVVSFYKFHGPDMYDLLWTSSRGRHEDFCENARTKCFRGISVFNSFDDGVHEKEILIPYHASIKVKFGDGVPTVAIYVYEIK